MSLPDEDLDLVGTTDISVRFGVSRSAPGAWERRHHDYPKRITTINGEVGIWHAPDIEAWLRKTGRLSLQKGHFYNADGYDVTVDELVKISMGSRAS